jgi:uncharacterized protein (TIGR02118 family)
MDPKLIYLAKRNPTIKAEDWPRTWRSHAVFASQFGSVGAKYNRVLYCSRVLGAEATGLSTAYDGVAVISYASREGVHAVMPPDIRAQIDRDELRVFSTNVPAFWFQADEALVHGGGPTGAAIIRFLARKEGSWPAAFLDRWTKEHGPLAIGIGDRSGLVRRYVHNRLTEPAPPGYPFDGISEQWFDDADAAQRAIADRQFDPILRDLAEFCDLEKSVTVLTYVTHRWPRA